MGGVRDLSKSKGEKEHDNMVLVVEGSVLPDLTFKLEAHSKKAKRFLELIEAVKHLVDLINEGRKE